MAVGEGQPELIWEMETILFLVVPGAQLSRTPSLSGTLDTSLRPGGGVSREGYGLQTFGGAALGMEPQTSCLRVRGVNITLRGPPHGNKILYWYMFVFWSSRFQLSPSHMAPLTHHCPLLEEGCERGGGVLAPNLVCHERESNPGPPACEAGAKSFTPSPRGTLSRYFLNIFLCINR